MLVPVGQRTKIEQDIWAGIIQCSQCGTPQNFHYCNVRLSARLLYLIPIFSMTIQRGVYCDCCGNGVKMNSKEYKRGCLEQIKKLKQGVIPPQIVAEDCAPGKVKLGQKVFFLLLAIIWGLIMLYACFGFLLMTLEGATSEIGVSICIAILFLLMGIYPFRRAFSNYRIASQKSKAYKKLKQIV